MYDIIVIEGKGCSISMIRYTLDAHRRMRCDGEVVDCPYMDKGCMVRMVRGKVKDHIKEYEYHLEVVDKQLIIKEKTIKELKNLLTAHEQTIKEQALGDFTLIGGQDEKDAAVSFVYQWESGKNKWNKLPSLHRPMSLCSAARVGPYIMAYDRLYLSQQIIEYDDVKRNQGNEWDVRKKKWISLVGIGYRPSGVFHTVNNSIYSLSKTMVINMSVNKDNQWSHQRSPDMLECRGSFASIVVKDIIYVFGGTALSSAECYAPTVIEEWISIPPPLTLRLSHTAVKVDDNTIWLLGGHDPSNNPLDIVEEYKIDSQSWTILPWRLSTPLHSFSAVYNTAASTLTIIGGRPHSSSETFIKQRNSDGIWYHLPPPPTIVFGAAVVSGIIG